MKLKQSASLSAAILAASLVMGLPSAAVAQQKAPSISVGHNVVDAVDDVRETTADFVNALLQAEEGLGVGNWEEQENRLNKINDELEQMELVLDEKAESTDQEWLGWLGDPDYSATVTGQIMGLSSHLDQIANILAENWQTKGIQVLVGNNVLAQLSDVGETTEDLLNALENAGDDYGWTTDPDQFKQARDRLAKMSDDIGKPQAMSDSEWRDYLESDQYHVVIHDNVATLADILKNLTKQNQS